MRRTSRGAAGAALVAAVAAGTLAAPALAAPAPDPTRHHRTQEAMDAAVTAGVPGVTAAARDKDGSWKGASGVGDLTTGRPRGDHDRYRVGSITKMFTATVVLQLEAEGKLSLDDTVEKWLPGVVRGHGHDGRKVTVRQLLNHTSGIYDATTDPEFVRKVFTTGFLKHRYDTWTPHRLIRMAMRHKPYFEPGAPGKWKYSNTNYDIAGLIVEKATGRPYGDEIRERVIEPLRLRATSVPGTESTVPQPSSRAYDKLDDPKGKPYDVTELNPSMAGAAGSMISDSADLNRFVSALLRGKLLPKKQLKEMQTTVSAEEGGLPGARYGLGLMRVKLPCGTVVWGHNGGIHGSLSSAMTTPDGRHALSFNFNGNWAGDMSAVTEAEFCPE